MPDGVLSSLSAESTNATVGKLGESSAEIGQVIKVITSIAQQTNLLALNATIEAARAANEITRNVGEAAKGSSQIVENIVSVATAAKSTTEGATNTQTAAQELARMAAELQRLVGEFKFDGGRSGTGPAEPHATSKQAREAQLASRAKTPPGLTTRLQ